MRRRTLLKCGALGGLAVAGGGSLWLAGAPAPIPGFASFAEAGAWLQRLVAAPAARSLTAWPLAQVLGHCAQSIEFSISGYPQPRSPLFQRSLGALAFAAFDRAGAMRHDTTEAIPGAPALADTGLAAAAARLQAALDAFAGHAGPLMPHFAYGALDHAQYTRAHLLHIAEHAAETRF